ncbi:MAG: pyridoxamine 5'-phosphate oxidase family protein [Pseudomonadales bacterium]
MPVLSRSERDGFLREPGVLMRVAVVRQDGGPLVTPIWFLYEDGAIYFTPREKSEWFQCLRRDPRVALCIDEVSWVCRCMGISTAERNAGISFAAA